MEKLQHAGHCRRTKPKAPNGSSAEECSGSKMGVFCNSKHEASQSCPPIGKSFCIARFPWENKVRCLSMLAMEIQNALRMAQGHDSKGVMKKSRVSASSHSP